MSQITEFLRKIKDENKSIGVAVEGGGLRGVVSHGLLSVLKDLGLYDQIHGIAGTSSGAINASYFLNDKMEDGLALYREMSSKAFIQPHRFPNAMNLDFLFLDRIPNHHPLDLDQLVGSNIPFFVTVTDVLNGTTKAIKAQDLKEPLDFLTLLRASASAPLFTTNTENLYGYWYNDGHVQMAIPYHPLLDLNLDYILCLQTQKKGYNKQENLFGKLHRQLALRRYSQSYKESFFNSCQSYNDQLREIETHPKLISIQIEPEDFVVSKMCKNPLEIDRCYEAVRNRFLK